MSAYFNSSTKWLSAVLGAEAPVPDAHKLVTAWIRWESGKTKQALNFAFSLSSSDEALLQGGFNNVVEVSVEGRGDGEPTPGTGQPTKSGTFNDDTWYLIGAWCSADDGVIGDVLAYATDGTAPGANTRTWANNTTADWDDWEIARSTTAAPTERWQGWVADIAIWTPATKTAGQDIMNDLFNSGTPLEADAITPTPIWYAKLIGSAAVETGTSLTNNGGVTFDSSIHPFAVAHSVNPMGHPIRGALGGPIG